MTKIEELLAEVEALDAKATKGPWEADFFRVTAPGRLIGNMGTSLSGGEIAHPDATYAARSRTPLPLLARVVKAMVEECEGLEGVTGATGVSGTTLNEQFNITHAGGQRYAVERITAAANRATTEDPT